MGIWPLRRRSVILLRMSNRPQLSAFIATSLDGYIARNDGGIDWLRVVEQPGEDYGYQAFMSSIDTLVMGRKTYDTALGFGAWPYSDKRCIVLTHRPAPATNGEEFFNGQPEQLAEKLAAEGARRVYIDGGEVIRQFLAARLLDDLTLSVVPILLGTGISLFGVGVPEQRLTLIQGRTLQIGLVQLQYRVS